jgi:hypothetical protein
MDLYPHLTHYPENRLALERERRLRQEIRAARAVGRGERTSRLAALTARLRGAMRPGRRPSLAEEC